jgi:hypothetical protein
MGFHKLGFLLQGYFFGNSKHGANSQSIKFQNLAKSPFSNVDLVWKYGFKHGGQNKVAIETTYIPHACVSEFL